MRGLLNPFRGGQRTVDHASRARLPRILCDRQREIESRLIRRDPGEEIDPQRPTLEIVATSERVDCPAFEYAPFALCDAFRPDDLRDQGRSKRVAAAVELNEMPSLGAGEQLFHVVSGELDDFGKQLEVERLAKHTRGAQHADFLWRQLPDAYRDRMTRDGRHGEWQRCVNCPTRRRPRYHVFLKIAWLGQGSEQRDREEGAPTSFVDDATREPLALRLTATPGRE